MKIVSIEEYSRKYMVFERKLLNLATNEHEFTRIGTAIRHKILKFLYVTFCFNSSIV